MAKRAVNTQMPSGKVGKTGGGQYGANKAPFNKPQSGGGIPTKFFDHVGGKAVKVPAAGQVGAPTSARPRPGTK